MFQISQFILLYELFFYIMYLFNINTDTKYVSFLLYPHICSISVLFFIKCDAISATLKTMLFILKFLFLIPLLYTKATLKNYFKGILVLMIYCLLIDLTMGSRLLVDLNTVYGCNININELLFSLSISSLFYYFLSLK
jgi:hypothetical protein